VITRRSMLVLTSTAAALAVAGLRGATARSSPPASLYGPYPAAVEVPAVSQALTPEMVREAVAMLQRDGVPPHADGFYRLYQHGRDYQISTAGVLETDVARKVRRFNERATSRTLRTSWHRQALDGLMRLLNRAGRLDVYRT
jgi:hypothetical protein